MTYKSLKDLSLEEYKDLKARVTTDQLIDMLDKLIEEMEEEKEVES